jgi:propionaldehyde dehydrogenase
MLLDEKLISMVTKKVLEEIEAKSQKYRSEKAIHDNIDFAIESATRAQKRFSLLDLEKREQIIKSIRETCLNNARVLAEQAVQETRMGRLEDKVFKNILAARKTPGTEDLEPTAWTGDRGLTLVERAPFGVIASITPVTNPTATVINNSISMIAAGNAVVFNPHPKAKQSSNMAVELINGAIIKAGGPDSLVCSISDPSVETASKLFVHPGIQFISVTGGPGVVKAALSSGKKAIGAGAGNPPVIIDETADFVKAAHDIVSGASFDNNLLCIAEKELIVVESIADKLMGRLFKEGAYILRGKDIEIMTERILGSGSIDKDLIGKDAAVILREIGIEVGSDVRLVVMEVGLDHPLIFHEQLMPVLPIVTVPTVDVAIDIAVRAEGGNRHTAIMHSKDIDNMTQFAKTIQTTLFVKNAPSYAGLGAGGEGYTSLTIAGPTGEGITSARTFTRERRCVLVDAFRIV